MFCEIYEKIGLNLATIGMCNSTNIEYRATTCTCIQSPNCNERHFRYYPTSLGCFAASNAWSENLNKKKPTCFGMSINLFKNSLNSTLYV